MKNPELQLYLGVGTDIVDIQTFGKLLQTSDGNDLSTSIFTPEELKRYGDRPESLAARFAAKEAVGKALGTGVPVEGWLDIEVLDDRDRPLINLYGWAKQRAGEIGLRELVVSLAHEHDGQKIALAFVVAVVDKKIQS